MEKAMPRAGRLSLPLVVFGLMFAASSLFPAPAAAQYFGRNKVQYESFDFHVLKTEHFDIYYYDEEEAAVRLAGRMAERWYARLSRLFDHQLASRQPIILYASHPHFEQTNAIFGQLGESTGGVTEIFKRRVVLPFAGALPESDHVLGHELVHAFQFDITRQDVAAGGLNVPGAVRLPLWFIEGMAEYLSLGPVDPHTSMWMRDAAGPNGELPTVRQLSNPKFFPYRYGQALWAFIGGEWGDESIGKILKVAGQTGDPEQAIAAVLQISADSLSTEWHAAVRKQYATVAERTEAPTVHARVLESKKTGSGGLNIGPALSPDGKQVVFLSEKSRFSVEMYLADVETGRIRKRLTKNATDPHFESLQFINSAGAWSADGRRFAFGAVTKGKPVLTILEMPSGNKSREIPFPDLDEIFTPSWSPDGRSVVFAAMVGGVTDLFTVDVESGKSTRLTHDMYADLQPAWSPDGDAIAFVTDRFTTDLTNLRYGNYRLATFELASREIQPLPVFGNGKHINPQWSPDGQSLYFLTDVSGITNIYRYEFAGGNLFQLTNLLTGVSGITALSPALTAAARADRLVYSVYEGNDYDLYVMDDRDALAGAQLAGPIAGVSPAVLPPQDRAAGLVLSLLKEPDLGLADTLTFEDTNYSGRLSLDFVGQPTLVAGADQFGTFFGGGASLYFSDMLGNRSLATVFQIDGSEGSVTKSSAVVLAYQNRRSRWNWGGQISQIPVISRAFTSGFATDPATGRTVFVDQRFRFFQINREIRGALAYPFNRSRRIEFSGGFRNIDFSSEVEQRVFDAVTGRLLQDATNPLSSDTIASLSLAIGSAAMVYDNALYGGTGPILGQRYRFEVTPTLGNLNFYTLLADYRRYFMPVRPLTLAARFVHFGRYSSDGEDRRLTPLFIGYPNLVRGYNDGSFDVSECKPTQADPTGCPVFDQLLGSRIAVANFEARLPLFGFFGIVPSPQAPPLELLAFFDAGVAWKSDPNASLFGERNPISSFGVGSRMNLLGIAIIELDFVHPNDRPNKNWYWEFSFAPGF